MMLTPIDTAVRQGLDEGLSLTAIGEKLGVTRQRIAQVKAKLEGRDKPRKPRWTTENERRVDTRIHVDAFHALEQASSERGIDVPTLIRRFLETAAEARLIDAVLDDREAA